MIKRSGYHILRVSMAITFLWIAVLIFREPMLWSGFIDPWFLRISPLDGITLIYIVGVFDALLGLMFLIDLKTHWAGFLAALHMFSVLTVSGIDNITVRDIAIFGASLSLLSEAMPQRWRDAFKKKAKPTGDMQL
ncbi:MAG: hypothetical protein Q8P30_01115 [Candidatus Uhrbacteria bacterium]|nr:hypothetical protein [Candidatus Uhrbacteria bacterium]